MVLSVASRTTSLLAVAFAVLTASAALADRVYLVDGGSYRGKVRREGDKVIVEIPDGSITLDASRVSRIEYDDTLFTTLAERRSDLDPTDADAHYELGRWALANDLAGPARDLFARAREISPDHAGANIALGWVYVDGSWTSPEALADMMDRWIEAGLESAAAEAGRQALAGMLPATDRRPLLRLMATAARRVGHFQQAEVYYRELVELLPPISQDRQRAEAIARVLASHPGGLYLVYLDEFTPTGPDGPDRSGYHSLAVDAVVDLALRDQAREIIDTSAWKLMAEAKSAELDDARRAERLYAQAEEQFALADALQSDIARSYRVESRRRRIQIHQRVAEDAALQVDGLNLRLKKALAAKDKAGYIRNLREMLTLLESIRKELDRVLDLAAAYGEEFHLVIAWTRQDKATVEQMERTIRKELQDLGRDG